MATLTLEAPKAATNPPAATDERPINYYRGLSDSELDDLFYESKRGTPERTACMNELRRRENPGKQDATEFLRQFAFHKELMEYAGKIQEKLPPENPATPIGTKLNGGLRWVLDITRAEISVRMAKLYTKALK